MRNGLQVLLIFAATSLPCLAQFQWAKIWFQAAGCESCTQSMEDRMRRLRGIETAKVDAKEGTLELHLAERNRVRLEQIRDMIQQDGTRLKRAEVRVSGMLSKKDGHWLLQPTGVSSVYEIEGAGLTEGSRVLNGEVDQFTSDSGRIRIRAR